MLLDLAFCFLVQHRPCEQTAYQTHEPPLAHPAPQLPAPPVEHFCKNCERTTYRTPVRNFSPRSLPCAHCLNRWR